MGAISLSLVSPALAAGHPVEIIELSVGEAHKLATPGLERLLIGDPALVEVERVAPQTIQLSAKAAGKTFLHIWDPQGRHTRTIRILPRRTVPPAARRRKAQPSVEHATPLQLGYEYSYEQVRRGQNVEQTDLDTTTRMRHAVSADMETPFGQAAGLAEFHRVNAFQDLTSWRASLTDARYGPVEHLDLAAGDARLPFGYGSFAMPSTGYRGASAVYQGNDPWRFSAMWGRERLGTIVPLTGGSAVEKDSFFSGGEVAYGYPEGPWSMRAAALAGYGDERGPTQSSQVINLSNTWRLLEPWGLRSDVAISEDEWSYTLGTRWQAERFLAEAVLRDIDQDFRTIVGTTADQGERGARLRAQWNPAPVVSLQAIGDVFRNRLFPNPSEPDTLNYDVEVRGALRPWSGMTTTGYASERSHLGFLSPTDDLRFGGTLSQRVPLSWLIPTLKWVTLFALAEHLDSRSVGNSALDFDAQVASLGASLPLWWGFSASASQHVRLLDRARSIPELREQPRRFTASLNYFSTLGKGSWDLRSRVAYQDEANAGSVRSFLAGEDRLLWDAGLRYHPWPWVEWFVNGRVEHVDPKSTAENRLELTAFAGARVQLDTKLIRWDPALHIEGWVFHDTNGDGLRQDDEEGVPDVTVVAGLARTAVTDDEGRFLVARAFGTSIPISLEVASLPKGYVVSTAPMQVIRADQRPVPMLQFGIVARAEVRGRVFYDVDEDGAYGAQDRGIEGVRLQLDERWATTDRSGWFFFRDLPGGRRTLSLILESLPVRFLPTVPVRQVLDIQEGQTLMIDLPVTVKRTLEGRVYLDQNQNRQLDRGERSVAGVSMCLDGRRVATTDRRGRFVFPGIRPGRHSVVLNCGLPLRKLVPLSRDEVLVSVGWNDPETTTVDFRLIEREALMDRVLKDLGGRR